jgi:hypothetical protein
MSQVSQWAVRVVQVIDVFAPLPVLAPLPPMAAKHASHVCFHSGGTLVLRLGAHNCFLAMHWTVVQLQGSVDVIPGTTFVDRVAAVINYFAAIVVLATFGSSLTHMVARLQEVQNTKSARYA